MLNLLLVLAGFLPLIIGANILVDGSASFAKKFNIPNIVIGLTVVAFGTSAPEMVVNIFAAINNNTGIVLGNIVGSNIFNILAILGISAIIYPLAVKTSTTWIEIPLAVLTAVLVFISANDVFFDASSVSVITRSDGLMYLLFFLIFIGYNIKLARTGNDSSEIEVKQIGLIKSIFLIISGFVLLVVGGRVIVTYAVKLAASFNISERVIALTIISIGTSLPELATSITAALKRNVDIAIGNVVGSNIFNVLFILGLSGVINPVTIGKDAQLDIMVNIISSLLLFIFVFTGKGRKIEKWEGFIFLVLYAGYIFLLFR